MSRILICSFIVCTFAFIGCDTAFDDVTQSEAALKGAKDAKKSAKPVEVAAKKSTLWTKKIITIKTKINSPNKVKLPCTKQIKCAAGTKPTDTTGDGCPDTCSCLIAIQCAPGFTAIDTTGNGCEDTCSCNTQILCAPDTHPIDSDGDGCNDTCTCDIIVDCAPGYQGQDTTGNGCVDSCVQICGTIAGLTCEKGMYCKLPDGMCGSADLGGTCEPIPQMCTKELNPQCDCSGETHSNPCMLAAAGAQLAHPGACCEPQDVVGVGNCKMLLGFYFTENGCESVGGCSCEGEDCGQGYPSIAACEALHPNCGDTCEAQDATGEGNCDMFFGFAFDGSQCVGVSGCSCVGSDCDNLSPDPKGCGITFSDCLDPCQADDAQGVGMCAAFFGYAWNGETCIGLGGCSCEGSDCGSLPMDLETCQKAHSGCALED